MIVLTKSRMSLKVGHMGSKTRSLGQIIGKSFDHSRGHIFHPIFVKHGLIVSLEEISDDLRSKSKSLG